MKAAPLSLILLLVLAGCASTPSGPRVSASGPRWAALPPHAQLPVPSPSWPLRVGNPVPPVVAPALAVASWVEPSRPVTEVPSRVAELPLAAPAALPLPQVTPLPVKLTPPSRSWTLVGQAKAPAVLPAPQAPAPAATAVVPAKAKAEPKTEAKAPTTVAASPQPKAPVKAVAPATPAASATLVPTETTTAPDFRWEDVNAVAGDAVTLHFDKANWLYLDTPAQQKTLGFQTINRDKDATTFQFRPLVPGQYTLEFQRQDLVNQSTDVRRVKLTVVASGTRTSTTGTALAPQTSLVPANDALEMARQLAAAGKTAEAVQKLRQSYKADDARMNLEMARLLNQSGQDDEALSYADKNLTLSGPDFQGTLELGTKLAAVSKNAAKELPTYVKLWTSGTVAPPEDLYLQVLTALRTSKLLTQAKDWSGRYGLWYPVPKSRDQYLFQLGQLLEEPGDGRDVKAAWKAYDEVVRSYPLSPVWKSAGERAAYLNRHFLQVR